MSEPNTTIQQKPTNNADAYWQANLKLIIGCLIVWTICSLGFGVLLRPMLAGIKIGGTDLGFWFAQQGSIIIFVLLIFFYAWRMQKLDAEFGVKED